MPAAEVCRSAVTAAVLRYPCTGVPLPALDGEEVDPSMAATKAGFVRMVLDLERSAA